MYNHIKSVIMSKIVNIDSLIFMKLELHLSCLIMQYANHYEYP